MGKDTHLSEYLTHSFVPAMFWSHTINKNKKKSAGTGAVWALIMTSVFIAVQTKISVKLSVNKSCI